MPARRTARVLDFREPQQAIIFQAKFGSALILVVSCGFDIMAPAAPQRNEHSRQSKRPGFEAFVESAATSGRFRKLIDGSTKPRFVAKPASPLWTPP
jgi:hypothetical protein